MKINKIRFKNINSFYGEHPAIDFNENPLAATGLFMISGPTGSGKSTLLDVISLALFNQIPRFSVKSLNSKQISANGSVINTSAAEEPDCEAFAEVEYEVKGIGYRSRWSISKNRNGNWREYDMEVSRTSDDEIISSKKSDAPVINEGLIGLKYGQFIQSIILSQGNFAEFLRAKEKERSRLLEDITGSHIYRKLGAAAFQKNKIAREQIKFAEQSLDSIALLSEEERQEKQEVLKTSQSKAKDLSEKLTRFRTQLNLKTQLEEAAKGITATTEKQERWVRDFEKFAPLLQKLERHLSVADLAKPLNDLEHLQKNLLRDQKTLTENEAEIKQLTEQNKAVFKQTKKLFFLEELNASNFEEKLTKRREEIVAIERSIDAIISEGKATAEAIKGEIATSKNEFINQLDPKDYQLIINRLSEYETRLNVGMSADITYDNEQLDELNIRFEKVTNWLHLLNEIKQLTDEGLEERKKLDEVKLKLSEVSTDIQVKQKEVEAVRLELKKLEAQQKEERKKVDLEKLRSELTEGEPCPLCGSASHPYRQHVKEILGEIETKLLEQENLFKKNETDFNELVINQKSLQTKEITHSERLEKLRNKYNATKQQCSALARALTINPEASEAELQNIKKTVQEKRNAINEYNKLRETLISIRQLKEWSLLNQERTEKCKKLFDNKKEIYSGENARQDCENLLNTFRKNQHTSEHITLITNQLTASVEATKKEKQRGEIELSDLLKNKGIATIATAKEQLLTSENVAQLNKEKERLQNEKITLATQLENFKNQHETCSGQLSSPESLEDLKMRVEALEKTYSELLTETGTVKNVLENDNLNRKKQAAKITEIDQLRKDARKWDLLNNYIGDANGDKYCNFAQSLTLNNLIGLANQRLKTLSDRYLLSKLTQDFDSLRVVDLYQGNSERSVDTLSGGETFTLSLAMALALSDMASQNVRLDSLFIDEGFGTLDGETLEAAIATLERLQHDTQKTIGIISHRQELMDRVSTQLIVAKGNDGKSTVSVSGF